MLPARYPVVSWSPDKGYEGQIGDIVAKGQCCFSPSFPSLTLISDSAFHLVSDFSVLFVCFLLFGCSDLITYNN